MLAKGEPDSSLSSLHHDINESKGKSALKASRLSDIMRFGFPGTDSVLLGLVVQSPISANPGLTL